jgi:hypothetical protein
MAKRCIAEYARGEFDALRTRLGDARDALRAANRHLQSVARAYYVVYATASFAAGKHGVKATHVRDRKRVTDQDFSHAEQPDVIYALYCGMKRGNITDPGGSPGIGSGNFTEQQAYRHANLLYQLRLEADYGPTTAPEPYGAAQIDAWLDVAKKLALDLETLL